MSENRIELENVSMRFEPSGAAPGPLVLDGISLAVERGSSLAVIGPSGSGKSTLLNILGGLLRPTSGRVLLNGRDLAAMDERERAAMRAEELGFVFQAHHLLPQLTALENALIPTLARDSRGERDRLESRARELLQRVGLGERLDHRPAKLSGGECQRVAVVRALINEPSLLLADEPTGSLDARSSEELGELLCELQRERDLTLIAVTHSPRLARRMQRSLELRDGKLAACEVEA